MKAIRDRTSLQGIAAIATILGLILDVVFFGGEKIANWILERLGEFIDLLFRPVALPLILVVLLFAFLSIVGWVVVGEFLRQPSEPKRERTKYRNLLFVSYELPNGNQKLEEVQCAQCEGLITKVVRQEVEERPRDYHRMGYWGVAIYCENDHFVGQHWTTFGDYSRHPAGEKMVIEEFFNSQIYRLNQSRKQKAYKALPITEVNPD